MAKTNNGNFFEDFSVGQHIRHGTPRTITSGDAALYTALYPSRFAVQSSRAFAEAIGYAGAPIDDLLVFHIVFGKTVSDISLNAVANLGYAQGRFLKTVYADASLHAESQIIGLKENSSGKTGTVYVRSRGIDAHGDTVLSYIRWVMVRKRDEASPPPPVVIPDLEQIVSPQQLGSACPALERGHYDTDLAGAPYRWGDYEIGERIDHVDGATVEEAEHQLATRSYQNTARVHFDALSQSKGRFGKRLVYGGYVISLARALSFNGLANAFHIAAINGGRHVAPLFAGDTVFAWSEVLDVQPLPGRDDVGALRLRLVATRDLTCASFPHKTNEGKYVDGVVLDFDYWALMIR